MVSSAEAQSNLGVLCAPGRGVPLDLVEAFKWLILADSQRCQRSAAYLIEISPQLTVTQLSEAQQRMVSFRKKKSTEPFALAGNFFMG